MSNTSEESTWIFENSIALRFTSGDATIYETLEKVLMNGAITIAIIVPAVSERKAEYNQNAVRAVGHASVIQS